jgi:hypothetical protein
MSSGTSTIYLPTQLSCELAASVHPYRESILIALEIILDVERKNLQPVPHAS